VTLAQKFGENVMLYRRRAGLSQEAHGFAASLHRTEISSLERGERLPKIDTLVKLAGGALCATWRPA
jgi:transcriptional regulator with XRE-family HTH domain